MKRLYTLLILVTFGSNFCNGQSNDRTFYSKDFNWSITIPTGFDSVSGEEWARVQKKGTDALERTTNEKVVNHTKTIFVFKKDQFNYFEANYQPFDTASDGDYLASCRNVNNLMYETFITQMPGMDIDTATSTQKIDDLIFQTYWLKIKLPNNLMFHMLMFSRLFDKKEFSVNIMYIDWKRGEEMLKAWESSKFH